MNKLKQFNINENRYTKKEVLSTEDLTAGGLFEMRSLIIP